MDKAIEYLLLQEISLLNFPFNIQIGTTSFLLHPVAETLGIFIGFRYFIYQRKKKGDLINNSNRVWIVIGALFGSLLGSRIIGGLENITALTQADNMLLHFYQNKTVLGGLLGGIAGVELIKIWIGEKNASGDLFVFPFMLALIIGRIGCFSMGIYEETYGTVTSSLTGMNLGDGLRRHPVTLYEILFLVLLWIALKKTACRIELANGAMFKLFMIAYFFFRFMLDFVKPHFTFNIGLSTIQLTCIAGLLWYLRYIIQPKKLMRSA